MVTTSAVIGENQELLWHIRPISTTCRIFVPQFGTMSRCIGLSC